MSLVLEPLINTTPDMRTLAEGYTPHGWPQLIVPTELILNVSPINWEGREEGREGGGEGGGEVAIDCFAHSLLGCALHRV